jgi:hypothetical protein
MWRLVASCALLSTWLVLLLLGYAAGGAVHLLLAASLAAFPWRGEQRGAAAGEPLVAAAPDAADGAPPAAP